MLDYIKNNHRISLVILLLILMIAAFHRRTPVDDAFISYRYAGNLVEGHGLVWNPGERVEGYSNFLWTLLVAIGIKLGAAPPVFVYCLAIPLHLAGLIITYILVRFVLSRTIEKENISFLSPKEWALVIVLWVGTNNSFAFFASSGMETPLQYLITVSASLLTVQALNCGWTKIRLIFIGLLLAIGILTRLDFFILTAVVLLVFYYTNIKQAVSSRGWKKAIIDSTLLLAPFLLIVIPFFIWKLNYYGDILPNSFYVKVRGFESIGYGFFYLYIFSICHLLPPFFIVIGWKLKWLLRKNRMLKFIAFYLLIWLIYIIYIGGDFMEFRFLVPILPFLGIAIATVLDRFIMDKGVLAALIVLLLLGNLNNQIGLEKTVYGYGIEKAESLTKHVKGDEQDWIVIGKILKEMFGGSSVLIATGPSGAIPYYSELPAVDILGLCDPAIPKIGEKFTIVPGHRIIAPLEYLVNRGVNLIIEPNNFMMHRNDFQLWVRLAGWRSMYKLNLNVDRPVNGRLIQEARLLVIPVNENYVLIAWYLTPHPAIEEAIREFGLKRIRLVRN